MLTFSEVSATLGWRGVLFLVWLGSMFLDYLSGTFAAWKAGEWSSTKAREGLFHKGGILFVVGGATALDFLLKIMEQSGWLDLPFVYSATLMPLTMGWFSATEIGSVIENAAKMGVEIPDFLRKFIKITAESVKKSGDEKTDEK